jgi:molecular chaperone DnaK (HSP70)
VSVTAEQPDAASRFVVGIDLGTTNSAACYVDTERQPWQVQVLAVPQLVAPRQVEARDTLPSFHYEPAAAERAAGALALPWAPAERDWTVGVYAREQGELVPGRLVSSAKSWLCHSGVDRTADLLPWHAAEDAARLSPVEASSKYLLHLREAWNHAHPQHPLEQQDLVVTLPASFDEVARELTVKAAARAGLPRIVLIEEPQAAFYAWIDAQGQDWERHVQPGQKIVVCDVGGGTTDFTLIRVRRAADGRVQFHRVAVGEHLILGGDNLDLALAHHVERRLAGDGRLPPRQWSTLVQSCRRVKETLLGPAPPQTYTLHLAGGGSRLIGGGQRVELTGDEVRQVLVEGFLPQVALSDRPQRRQSGFQEFGLPYAADPAITRHLAEFLLAHRHAGEGADQPPLSDNSAAQLSQDDATAARPDIVLFNGGFFESPVLRDRLLEVMRSWFPGWQPVVLHNDRLDLAVARGAAYYGLVRRGHGVRIAAGLARSYYLGVDAGDTGAMAMCLAPAGLEEGRDVEVADRTVELRIRQPVEFPLFVSSTRLTDAPGALVPIDPEQLTALPPIRTVLEVGKKSAAAQSLPVRLHARLTEIGTLEVGCRELSGDRSWRLQFDVRSATQTDVVAHRGAAERQGVLDDAQFAAAREALLRAYRPAGPARPEQAEGLVKSLEALLELRRSDWPATLLRRMWEVLLEVEDQRAATPIHEARWLYLVGFCLRPGYGLALDDWRVAQTWRLFQGKKLRHGGPVVRVEWLILWRRLAGGLAAGQQRSLAEPIVAALRPPPGSKAPRSRSDGASSHEQAEMWRLLGSLEWLPIGLKVELAGLAAAALDREKTAAVRDALAWTVGRLGARVPAYGPLNVVPPPEAAERWLATLLEDPAPGSHHLLAAMQLARRTGDRYRDIGEKARGQVGLWLAEHAAPPHYQELIRTGGELAADEEGLVFGESLPAGLRLAGERGT